MSAYLGKKAKARYDIVQNKSSISKLSDCPLTLASYLAGDDFTCISAVNVNGLWFKDRVGKVVFIYNEFIHLFEWVR